MAYPTNRSTFKTWIKQLADENAIGVAPFSGNAKLEVICDAVIAEYSVINPLWAVGTITIDGQYAILPSDWVEGPKHNTDILYCLQRGIDPTLKDLSQSGYDTYNSNSYRFGSSTYYGNGYGLGTGGASMQDPIVPAISQQDMPKSSSAIISGVQKKVFILPTINFSDGQTFDLRYCAYHIVRDTAGATPAMMTIDLGDLADVFDKTFARAVKARIFFAVNANEVAGEDKYDISRLDKLASHNPFTSKY
jgi:hypothetical protein